MTVTTNQSDNCALSRSKARPCLGKLPGLARASRLVSREPPHEKLRLALVGLPTHDATSIPSRKEPSSTGHLALASMRISEQSASATTSKNVSAGRTNKLSAHVVRKPWVYSYIGGQSTLESLCRSRRNAFPNPIVRECEDRF